MTGTSWARIRVLANYAKAASHLLGSNVTPVEGHTGAFSTSTQYYVGILA